MKKQFVTAGLVFLAMVIGVGVFAEEEWETYNSDAYGFEMKLPPGTKLREGERLGGWAYLKAQYGIVEIMAYVKLGSPESADKIEAYAYKLLSIPAKNWSLVDKGKNSKGWKWYKVYIAKKFSRVHLLGFGIGPKGSYLVHLKTTAKNFKKYEDTYVEWYETVKLF